MNGPQELWQIYIFVQETLLCFGNHGRRLEGGHGDVGEVIFRGTCVLAKGSGIGAELSVAPPHLWCLDEHCCPVIMRSQCQEE